MVPVLVLDNNTYFLEANQLPELDYQRHKVLISLQTVEQLHVFLYEAG